MCPVHLCEKHNKVFHEPRNDVSLKENKSLNGEAGRRAAPLAATPGLVSGGFDAELAVTVEPFSSAGPLIVRHN